MLQIHGVPVSVHTRKVVVTAIEKGLAYTNEPVIPLNPPPGWEHLSPTGKIPVMVDGDVSLCDSTVICTYLERAYPARPVYPRETKDYIDALWFEEYADGTIYREVVHPLFFQGYIRPNILKQEGDRAIIETTLRDSLPKVFGYLEGALHGDTLAGSQWSLADTAVVSNLVNFHYLGYTLDTKRHPKLAAYFERGLRQPSMARALEAERPVAEAMGLALEGVRVQDR
jgi:glutathione S-transferase